MDITASNYHRDLTENGLKTFLAAGRIGILHLESGKKTMPTFDRVIISSKYIFVEAKAYWGILNLDLSLVLSPICKEIFPVNMIDRDYFILNSATLLQI